MASGRVLPPRGRPRDCPRPHAARLGCLARWPVGYGRPSAQAGPSPASRLGRALPAAGPQPHLLCSFLPLLIVSRVCVEQQMRKPVKCSVLSGPRRVLGTTPGALGVSAPGRSGELPVCVAGWGRKQVGGPQAPAEAEGWSLGRGGRGRGGVGGELKGCKEKSVRPPRRPSGGTDSAASGDGMLRRRRPS